MGCCCLNFGVNRLASALICKFYPDSSNTSILWTNGQFFFIKLKTQVFLYEYYCRLCLGVNCRACGTFMLYFFRYPQYPVLRIYVWGYFGDCHMQLVLISLLAYYSLIIAKIFTFEKKNSLFKKKVLEQSFSIGKILSLLFTKIQWKCER